MIIYFTHKGGKYFPVDESLKLDPSTPRGLYVNLTNRCNCDCVFCLRQKKSMARESSLWLEREPTVDEVKAEFDNAPWHLVTELVFCGFGEPTIRLAELVELLTYAKKIRPNLPTRLNTNGLGELYHGREIAADFDKILDTVSISLNAATAEKYFKLTRAAYGLKSFDAMLTFAEHMKNFVPHVVLTVVDKVTSPEEISVCQKICDERNLTLRVRPYEDS
ncbi:MAG: TatD family nuclease-associated radical SAM protein [Selenomonadaceae bacterium]|nr:TatD family nuclease-associated radical SAM protein [Selenomonadaceae bacterium]